jgi:hypothetical protein
MNALRCYLVLNPPVPEVQSASSGQALAQAFHTLDEWAEEKGLIPLTHFADQREIPEDFDETPEELDGLLDPWDQWFECAEGVAAFQALAQAIRNLPRAEQRLPEAPTMAGELEDMAQVLAQAQVRGCRFRLEIG